MKPFKETRYTTILTVHIPAAPAAFDMMRYDRCCPYREEDSRRLWALNHGGTEPKDHIVKFMRFGTTTQKCCAERWKSFACTVIDERSPMDEEMTDEQALAFMAVR